MNMFERVARQIAYANSDYRDKLDPKYEVMAKAAIDAMSEPTQEMVDNAISTMPFGFDGDDDNVYREIWGLMVSGANVDQRCASPTTTKGED